MEQSALNQTIEAKVESITQPLVTKVEENMSVIKKLKNENDKLKNFLCETNQRLDVWSSTKDGTTYAWSKTAEEPGEDTDNSD